MLAAALVIVPAGIAWWALNDQPAFPLEGVVLGLVSGTVEAGYFILLSAAYRRGDLSVVYPLARGTAPLVAVFIGVVILGERLGVAGSIGVVLLLLGFLWLQRPWQAFRRGGSGLDPAVLFAIATGLTIAAYSAIDRVGHTDHRARPVRRDPVGDDLCRARRLDHAGRGRGHLQRRSRWRTSERRSAGC